MNRANNWNVLEDRLLSFYHGFYDEFGDSYRGVGWTKSQEVTDRRNRVLLDFISPDEPGSLLDVGCGLGHTLEYIRRARPELLTTGAGSYTGIDLSEVFVAASREKFPDVVFEKASITDLSEEFGVFDYAVLSGLFTAKGKDNSHSEFWEYCRTVLSAVSKRVTKGFAFNASSPYVDWERDDLFHLRVEDALGFLSTEVSRSFSVRHDYGLFEYTVYVYLDDPK